MLHFTPPMPTGHETLAAGDVVSFRFPSAERPHALTKARPCLVLAVEDRLDGPYALLAYGTARFTRANRGYEIALMDDAKRRAAGVVRPMRFVCARRVWASLNDPRFSTGRDRETPRLGQLDGTARADLADILAALPRHEGRIPAFNQPAKRTLP